MSIIDRMGRYAHDRLCDQLAEVVDVALDHGLSPKEVVGELQEMWSVRLHDKSKRDMTEFNEIMREGR